MKIQASPWASLSPRTGAREAGPASAGKAASPTPAAAPLPTHANADTTPEQALSQSLSDALRAMRERMDKPKLPARSAASDMAQGWQKAMLKEKLEMLRKMMALAGNDAGSRRAIAQQLAQVARELKALGEAAGAPPPEAGQAAPPASDAEAGASAQSVAGTDATQALQETPTPPADSQAASQSGTQAGWTEGADGKTPAEETTPGEQAKDASQGIRQEEQADPALQEMVAKLKQLLAQLKQGARGDQDADTDKAIREIEQAIREIEGA
ncbi:hypothetical protein [Crenobacter caeni]|uniref:Uncharacterized protein n=1 Tax=Crenobacter caeni TaxID=2705474 RepID=A0A6B2KQD2_9NEIS|nr:hypothetical protein [Crenobacter caeni]NDV12261.1 hypothetical protein [Crenobacter caeni]